MTKEETKKAIEVMRAYVDGKSVECRSISGPEWLKWLTLRDEISWDWSTYEYRVKPEPMEIEVLINPSTGAFHDPRYYSTDHDGYVRKKFREVIE